MTIQTLESLRNDNLYWTKVNQFASLYHANEPQLPRQRKRPTRFEEGTSQERFHQTPKDYYRQYYFGCTCQLYRSVLTSLNTKCTLHLNLCLLSMQKRRL